MVAKYEIFAKSFEELGVDTSTLRPQVHGEGLATTEPPQVMD